MKLKQYFVKNYVRHVSGKLHICLFDARLVNMSQTAIQDHKLETKSTKEFTFHSVCEMTFKKTNKKAEQY